MASKFKIKQGDRRPYLKVRLIYTDDDGNEDGVPDLTLAENVVFSMYSEETDTLIIDEGEQVFILGDPTLANVEYRWQAGDTATAGDFKGEFEVDWGGGETETFPNDEEGFNIKITPQLAPRT